MSNIGDSHIASSCDLTKIVSPVERIVDSQGRIVIPSKWRKRYNMNPYSSLNMIGIDQGIILLPYKKECCVCGSACNSMVILSVGEKESPICDKCLSEIHNKRYYHIKNIPYTIK